MFIQTVQATNTLKSQQSTQLYTKQTHDIGNQQKTKNKKQCVFVHETNNNNMHTHIYM